MNDQLSYMLRRGPALSGYPVTFVFDASRPEQTSSSDEKARIEPPITQSTRVEIHRQAHILIAPVSRLIRCRCSFKSVRLFNQARVVKQYRFAVVGDEWQTDIGPPKA